MYIFVSSSLIDDVVTYSAVDSIANLSDHLPVLCVIHAAKFTGSNARNTGNKSKRVNCVKIWDKIDLAIYYCKSGEYLRCISVP